MNKKISKFLDDVCIHIQCKAVHEDIREELTQHVDALKQEYEMVGLSSEESLDLAIAAMGDADEIGNKLDKQHKPKTEWSIIALTVVISLIGGMVMYASSNFYDGISVNFFKYICFTVLGIIAMVSLYFFDYTKMKKLALPIYIGTIMLLTLTLIVGVSANGSRSFLRIGELTIAPEYATLLFLISFAGFMEKYRGQGGIAIAKLIGLAVCSLLPLMAMPNLATVLVLLIGYVVMMITAVFQNHFAGGKRTRLLSLGGLCTAIAFFGVFVFIRTPNKLDHLTIFLSRGQSDPMRAGWPQVMADKWLSLSVWFGKTDALVEGHGLDKVMPGVTTDYVLINVIVTFGWAVGIILIVTIALFIIRMFLTTRKLKDNYGFYLALAACLQLSTHFVISILVNFNLFPRMSMSMPFVSYGGTGYVVSMAFVGIILSVWRRNTLIASSPKAATEKTMN